MKQLVTLETVLQTGILMKLIKQKMLVANFGLRLMS